MGSLKSLSSHSLLGGALESVSVREKHFKSNEVWTSEISLYVLGRYFREVASALRGLSLSMLLRFYIILPKLYQFSACTNVWPDGWKTEIQ